MPWLLLILRWVLYGLLGPRVERVAMVARADGRVEQGEWTEWMQSFSLHDGPRSRACNGAGMAIRRGAACQRGTVRWGPAARLGRDAPPPRGSAWAWWSL
jgi:hypothetical protein